MTKKDLITTVADNLGMSQKEVSKVLEETLAAISTGLAQKEEIILKDFGRFYIKQRKGRTGRNPQTGEIMTIPEKEVVDFKPASKVLLYSSKL